VLKEEIEAIKGPLEKFKSLLEKYNMPAVKGRMFFDQNYQPIGHAFEVLLAQEMQQQHQYNAQQGPQRQQHLRNVVTAAYQSEGDFQRHRADYERQKALNSRKRAVQYENESINFLYRIVARSGHLLWLLELLLVMKYEHGLDVKFGDLELTTFVKLVVDPTQHNKIGNVLSKLLNDQRAALNSALGKTIEDYLGEHCFFFYSLGDRFRKQGKNRLIEARHQTGSVPCIIRFTPLAFHFPNMNLTTLTCFVPLKACL
jgi:hypothetical protein